MHAFDAFYDFLARIGYAHPVHPVLVHMPIGLMVGAFFFVWMALLFRYPRLRQSSYHALVVAFIFWFPTVLFGVVDWQRYFGGAWIMPIKVKLSMAGVLFILMLGGLILGRRTDNAPKFMVPIYSLSFVCVVVLGYYGGQLVYGEKSPTAPKEYLAGMRIFDKNCSGCHAHGGNIIKPNLPLRNAPQLEKFDKFREFIRDPELPNGQPGPMPKFSTQRLPDSEAKQLYDYIVNVIAHPKRE